MDQSERFQNSYAYHRKKIAIYGMICFVLLAALTFRVGFLMIFQSEYYTNLAQELHERERSIKAARGKILDATGTVIADNKTVCTISVIHSQISDPEKVIEILTEELSLEESFVRKRVEKKSSIERVRSNVSKEIGDRIRAYELDGVKVDEDYKRYYPFGSLCSKVLGFTGSDNQGIVGLEVAYDSYLQGKNGTILTETDAFGVEITGAGEKRIEPVAGYTLVTGIDMNIQTYATQLAYQVMEKKQAESVSIIVMNPQNGEIMAMVNVPEFDLNDPFTLTDMAKVSQNITDESVLTSEEKQDALNRMWRNACINDTYEPGSVFKIVTAAIGLETGAVTVEDTFSCPGFVVVDDRRIRCHKKGGHGAETFLQGTMNSCNPVFVTVGLRIGLDNYYKYMKQFGLLSKTGIDLPGEAATIMHAKKNMGNVELATVSFGQSFQITAVQMAATASSIVNGGIRVTPHVGVRVIDENNEVIEELDFATGNRIISEETAETMQYILEQVVSNGTGKNGYVEGYSVGGKTATSETLPRGHGRYIASFLGFSPADNPTVLAMAIINNPQGVYYGGQIAAPVIRQLFENILPYLESLDYN